MNILPDFSSTASTPRSAIALNKAQNFTGQGFEVNKNFSKRSYPSAKAVSKLARRYHADSVVAAGFFVAAEFIPEGCITIFSSKHLKPLISVNAECLELLLPLLDFGKPITRKVLKTALSQIEAEEVAA